MMHLESLKNDAYLISIYMYVLIFLIFISTHDNSYTLQRITLVFEPKYFY